MMKKTVLIWAAICVLFPAYVFAMEYQHKFEADDMEVFWTIDKEQIHVKLTAKTTGWVAIGFDPESAMQGANIIIGAVKNGKVKIEDHYGDRKRGHSPDEKLGGENHVLNPAGEEADGVTTISFSLALDSGDKWDKAIVAQGTSRIMVAYGSGRDSFKAGHKYRGVYDINYSTGETKKIK
jgi:hypothetical protein